MDNNLNYHSRYSSTREQSSGLFNSPLPFALALLCGGAAIFGFWYFFYAGSSKHANQPIPIVKAEAGPMKVKPDNAAQPEVPHQDKLVYGRVNPAERAAGVERLLPPTEEPVDMAVTETAAPTKSEEGFPNPHIKAADKSDFRTEPLEPRAIAAPEVSAPAPKEQQEDFGDAQFTSEHLPGTLVREEAAPAEKSKKVEQELAPEAIPAKTKETPAAPKTLQSGYRVQLASMKSQDQAKSEWRRLQNEHKGVLSNLNATYSRVDLGASKGVYYRVQAGDFASKNEAQNVCSKLKSQNPSAGCLIVKF